MIQKSHILFISPFNFSHFSKPFLFKTFVFIILFFIFNCEHIKYIYKYYFVFWHQKYIFIYFVCATASIWSRILFLLCGCFRVPIYSLSISACFYWSSVKRERRKRKENLGRHILFQNIFFPRTLRRNPLRRELINCYLKKSTF